MWFSDSNQTKREGQTVVTTSSCLAEMKMNFTVSLVLLVAFIIGNVSGGFQEFVPVGCFKDSVSHRALPELVVNFRTKINWNNLNQTIEDCAQAVAAKGYMYFSLQFYGECWSGPQAHHTYDRFGSSKACVAGVGKGLANYVYRFVGEENECSEYRQLSSSDRSISYKSSQTLCDQNLQVSWYRFISPAGTRLADSCPSEHKGCGTIVPGWLKGTAPSVPDGISPGTVCFNWNKVCCQWSQNIQVRNCGRFYVYKLGPTFGCPLRFCASK